MKEEVKNNIKSGNFEKAKKVIEQTSNINLEQIILELGFDDDSISAYSFMFYMITLNETAENHYLASKLLVTALNHIPDAYASGLFHARKAIELNPEDVSLKEYLLLFYEIPEKLIDEKEAKIIANEVIKQNPHSKSARLTLNNSEIK